MAPETLPPELAGQAPKTTDNMIAIDSKPVKAAAPASRLREMEEDLARLQDQLMDVLEENQQLRAELEAWRIGARVVAKHAS